MAIFRKVHTSFWSDSFTSDLSGDEKLFYLYLLTNERTKQCGIYEITLKQISFDLGYSMDKVSKLLKHFIGTGKIRYNEQTKELAIGNWLKYNSSNSPKVVGCMNKEFALVKDTVLIEYVKSMDTQSQEEQEEEQQEEEEKKEDTIIWPFDSEEFKNHWGLWVRFKKEQFKFTYKSDLSLQGALKELAELSGGIEETAIKIISQSINNGWKGFFALKTGAKTDSNTPQTNKYTANDAAAQEILIKLQNEGNHGK